jgi:stearoyl-CoA desaturase (delta-9 desaturase)
MSIVFLPPLAPARPARVATSSPATDTRRLETFTEPAKGWQRGLLWLFLLGPFVALALGAALALTAGVGPTWLDLGLAVGFYVIAGHGVTAGFHRYFTHRSFTATRSLRIALAVAGSLSVEGTVTGWVADHRRHHAQSDQPGDPHSPWRFGFSTRAVAKGMLWAQVGWFFGNQHTSRERFCPDLLADPDIRLIDRLFPLLAVVSLTAPALLGGLITMNWRGALTALIWAGLVRMLVLHHVTWSINSVCHVAGRRPLRSRDRSGNVWWLAVPSMGESWHNVHHAAPTSARHGVNRWQLDSTARLIRWLEVLRLASDIRRPALGCRISNQSASATA